MKTTKMLCALGALFSMLFVTLAPPSQAQTAKSEGLLVVYGVQAPTREGDVDHREQIFFSVPADTEGRFFVRVFDPEIFGTDDFTYGGPRDSITTFRVFGGQGAFSAADRPQMAEEQAGAESGPTSFPVTGPGKILTERAFDDDRATDGRWVSLGSFSPRQGETIGDRTFFRLDVEGTKGNDGNGYSVGVSRARDGDRPPEGLEIFGYHPTIRWTSPGTATQLSFIGTGGPYTVQSFDAASGDIAFVTDYSDVPVRASGQDFWSSDKVETADKLLALRLMEGQETPNDITVAVFDGAGAPVALGLPPKRAPRPSRPVAAGAARPLANCQSVAFDASASQGQQPLGYLWEFGDGSSADKPVIAHLYQQPGRYTARLKVREASNRPGAGHSVEVPVHVRTAPVARPGEPVVIAPGEVLRFDGLGSVPSDSPIIRYRWTFGDGEDATGPVVEKTYAAPGLYRAVLRVEDDSEHPCDFGVATREVKVNFPPVAEAGTDQTAKVGQTVALDAGASYDVDGTIQQFVWDMGDGTAVEGGRVTHEYSQPGTYRVVLKVTDDSGVENAQSTDALNIVVNAPPEPVIALPDRPVSVSEAATLDGSASTDADGAILSYLWEFGDGAIGEGEKVSYAWTAPGTYTVALTVTDNSGTASAVQRTTSEIVVDAAPIAEAGPDQFVTVSDVHFDGTGSTDQDGEISSYEWTFGDGNSATGPRPTHAYARPGIYKVALVVRDASGAPLNTDRDEMRVTVNAPPIADAGPPLTVAPGEEFVLSARSSVDPDGAIDRFEWQLPSGETRNRERIALRFDEPGSYRVGLSVFDNFPGGSARDDDDVMITVNDAPVAEAGPNRLVAPGDTVVLDAAASYDRDGEIINHLWEFDDGMPAQDTAQVSRSYDTPGTWTAQLVVADNASVANSTASDVMTVRVNAAPVAEAGPAIETDILQVTLDGSGSADADGDALIYSWDLGDGSPPRKGQTITHVYQSSGTYPVTLRVDDGTGVSNAGAVDATTVVVNARPVAEAGGNREVCSGEPVLFDASSSLDPDGGLLRFEWDFGEGTTSDLVNPTMTYEMPGSYTVTLRIRNGKNSDWGSDLDRVAVLVREGPIADAGPDLTVYANQAIRLDGSGSTDIDGSVNSFNWTLTDEGTLSGEQPEYRFQKPGTYVATLTIKGEAIGDCSPLDTDTATITVLPGPSHQITAPDRAAAGVPSDYAVEVQDLDTGEVVDHEWRFSDGATAKGAQVSHTFAEPGVHFATLQTRLTGTETGLEVIESRHKVIVNAAPVARFEGPVVAAAGAAIVLDGSASSDPDGVITEFVWDFGDGNTATGVLVSHSYAKAGSYLVRLAVNDEAAVQNSIVQTEKWITVNPEPVGGLQLTRQYCAGSPVPLSVSVGPDTQVDWTFGDGATATGAEVSHAFAQPGLYPVTVSLDDGKGLLNSQRVETAYARINAVPTAIAGPDKLVDPGSVVVFDASGSEDLDGNIVSYSWQFSDGVMLEGMKVERQFDISGPVKAELTVTDDSGSGCAQGNDALNVLVNSTPQVDAGADRDVLVGAAHDVVVFDVRDAVDADGHGLSFAWDFGDGTTATGSLVRHAYGAPGTYEVTVTAQDTTKLQSGVGTDTVTVRARRREN